MLRYWCNGIVWSSRTYDELNFCLPPLNYYESVPMRSPQLGNKSALFIRSHLLRTGVAVLLLSTAFFAFAMGTDVRVDSPDWLQLCLGLFGGLALVLFIELVRFVSPPVRL